MSSLDRRQFLSTLAAPAAQRAASAPPNVLIVLTDDQGYGDLSCHGNPVLKTPNLDRLHSQSVRFTDFHSAPMCTPTRGQLLSGLDALYNRATSVTAGRAVLRKDVPTMANIFGAAGYRTGIFGKWHVGDNYPYRPMDRGFQEAKYHLGFGMSSAPEFGNDYFNGRYRDKGVVKRFEGYCTDFWFREAMQFMRESQSRKQPFLCYLPTNAPHGPHWVDEKYAAPYKKLGGPANFFGMIANIDENMGKLERFLTETGLRDNTIVIFMTDNGGTAGVKIFNAGMRGRKQMYYDGGHRVPCFIRWPNGKLRQPGDIATPAHMQDILPTLIELCGVKKPANARFDGVSLAPLLRGAGTIADRMLVVQYGQILKKWDSCTIWGKWRLVGHDELYDLREDPGQEKNVASSSPEVLAKMRAYYEAWWQKNISVLDDYQAISLGAPQENPVCLSSSDWQDVYADNPGHVSNAVGGPRGGPWNVFIERDGEYQIALSRWHPNDNLPLIASRPAQKMTAGELPEGKAMPIGGATLTIAGQTATVKTKPEDKTAVFKVRLKGGVRTKLHGWFLDKAGNDLCGAFYAVVTRL